MSNPLSKRPKSLPPSSRRFRQLDRKFSRQPTVSIPLFEEPFLLQWSTAQPTQEIRVNLWANWLHKIAGQTVPRARVAMENTDTGIKSQFRNREPCFGF